MTVKIQNRNIMNKNIKNLFRLGVLATAGLFAMYSCTDDTWDEHYDTKPVVTYDGTIMDAINSNPELKDFAEILDAVGFDLNLNGDQVYTIWVPKNMSEIKDSLMQEVAETTHYNGKQEVLRRFVKNHIALYNISLNTEPQKIALLNSKFVDMSAASEATIGEAKIDSANIVCNNGVMHIIDRPLTYTPNMYESMETEYNKYLREHPEIDKDSLVSLFSFLDAYNQDSLDEARSVELGLNPDGNMVYVDSVMIRNNTILKSIDAFIYEEDSTYYAILPSVEAFQKRYEEAKKLLQFSPSENVANPLFTDSLQKRYANMFAMRDLYYNMGPNVNTHREDSVMSTLYRSNWEQNVYYRPFAEGGIFAGNSTKINCSNGTVFMVDEYPMSQYEQFFYKLSPRVTSASIDETLDDSNKPAFTKNCTYSNTNYNLTCGSDTFAVFPVIENKDTVRIDTLNYEAGEEYEFSYLRVIPSSGSANPTFSIKLSNTLSGEYDIYLVTVPIRYRDENLGGDPISDLRAYKFKANLFERDEEGEFPKRGVALKANGKNTFTTNPAALVDTTYLGSHVFDYSYYGRDKEGVLLQIAANVNSRETTEYSREMLVHKVILMPRRKENPVE